MSSQPAIATFSIQDKCFPALRRQLSSFFLVQVGAHVPGELHGRKLGRSLAGPRAVRRGRGRRRAAVPEHALLIPYLRKPLRGPQQASAVQYGRSGQGGCSRHPWRRPYGAPAPTAVPWPENQGGSTDKVESPGGRPGLDTGHGLVFQVGPKACDPNGYLVPLVNRMSVFMWESAPFTNIYRYKCNWSSLWIRPRQARCWCL